ncbi:MAG TPA: DsbA family protein [Longimicrobium sp.]
MPRPAPAKQRRSLTPFYVLLGLVLVAGLGVLATQLIGTKSEGANQGVRVTLTPDQLQRVKGISRGREDAPITIYEFADFQCPHCAEFAWKLEPVIVDSLVNTGKARYVFFEFPLGFKWSFLSARSGRCANEQGKFWEYHQIIFARQTEWAFDKDPAAKFTGYATQAGLDGAKFEECVRSDRYVREVSESAQLAQSLGVQGTPTLFINGRKIETPSSYRDLAVQVRAIAPGAFGAAPAPASPVTAPADSPAAAAAAPAGT